jgi:broad specificity phosphatase PhoE
VSKAARLVLVRHGQAAAGWDADLDPGLSDLGREQAAASAAALEALGPVSLLTSPLRRARQTAEPLEKLWRATAVVEPGIGEIPSPTDDLAARASWLGPIMRGTWADAGPEVKAWRQRVLDTLTSQSTDAVAFSHFIAINVAVGEAIGDPRVVCFLPDNGSRTAIDVADGRLRLVERGAEAETVVR